MKLYIKNIGMIREATILLNGLTVVAGKNDSGKSTIGKILYCIIKTLNTFRKDHNKNLANSMMVLFVDAHRYFRSKATSDGLKEMINKIEPSTVSEKLYNTLSKNQYKEAEVMLTSYLNELYRIAILLKEEKSPYIAIYTQHIESFINDDLHNVASDEYRIKRTLGSYIQAEFKNEISNKYFESEFSYIKLYDGEFDILEIVLKNNEILDVKLYNKLFINDITYIESPVCLKKSFNTFHGTRESDLDMKLKSNRNVEDSLLTTNTSYLPYLKKNHKISDIINGDIFYNQVEREFNYQRKDNIRFNEINTAMGIKAIGIFDLLIKNGFLDNQKILVIDEPEVHLHPEWQVEYFKYILNICLNYGCFILINSHSPYIIQVANYYYGKQYKTISFKEKLNFYFSIKKEKYSIFEHCNDNLGEIFTTLSKPLEDLFWED